MIATDWSSCSRATRIRLNVSWTRTPAFVLASAAVFTLKITIRSISVASLNGCVAKISTCWTDRREQNSYWGRTTCMTYATLILATDDWCAISSKMRSRHLANRIATQAPLTKEILTHLHPDDIRFPGVPAETTANLDRKFRVICPGCARASVVPTEYLARRVDCPCGKRFRIDWGEVFE